jgi:hypothetical protein
MGWVVHPSLHRVAFHLIRWVGRTSNYGPPLVRSRKSLQATADYGGGIYTSFGSRRNSCGHHSLPVRYFTCGFQGAFKFSLRTGAHQAQRDPGLLLP